MQSNSPKSRRTSENSEITDWAQAERLDARFKHRRLNIEAPPPRSIREYANGIVQQPANDRALGFIERDRRDVSELETARLPRQGAAFAARTVATRSGLPEVLRSGTNGAGSNPSIVLGR